MKEEVRTEISEHSEQLILTSKELIERSREILNQFGLAKERCKSSGLVSPKRRGKPTKSSAMSPSLPKLSPYQEAIRLSALIELHRGVHSAAVAMTVPNRQKAAIDATDAYQEAVAMLTHAQVSMADSMVHDEIVYLRQLLHQIDQQVDQAA